jgi:hypothetical protein
MTFEIGFVPRGWRRGLPLRVMRPKDPWRGFVSLDHARLPHTEKLPADAEGLISFSSAEAESLDAWLDWWNKASNS